MRLRFPLHGFDAAVNEHTSGVVFQLGNMLFRCIVEREGFVIKIRRELNVDLCVRCFQLGAWGWPSLCQALDEWYCIYFICLISIFWSVNFQVSDIIFLFRVFSYSFFVWNDHSLFAVFNPSMLVQFSWYVLTHFHEWLRGSFFHGESGVRWRLDGTQGHLLQNMRNDRNAFESNQLQDSPLKVQFIVEQLNADSIYGDVKFLSRWKFLRIRKLWGCCVFA